MFYKVLILTCLVSVCLSAVGDPNTACGSVDPKDKKNVLN